jgi:hypothetical protein
MPSNIEELYMIKGIKEKKVEAYGKDILSILSPYQDKITDANKAHFLNSKPVKKTKPKKVKVKENKTGLIDEEININNDYQNKMEEHYTFGLNSEQLVAYKRAVDGNNLFLTGQAGTGLKFIINILLYNSINFYF